MTDQGTYAQPRAEFAANPYSLANPCFFAAEPLQRISVETMEPGWARARLADPGSMVIPLFDGGPLMRDGEAVFLSASAMPEFGADAAWVFLGLSKKGTAYFAVDATRDAGPEAAPFSDMGAYIPLREAAGALDPDDLAIIGQGRWFLDWHRRHRFCAACGSETEAAKGGAKRQCPNCGAEHFPRTDPVAIVLATHEDACLLGRGVNFPPGMFSALAGFVEGGETPEQCARRELLEEAGVELTAMRYLFSQPWPFPSSMMMGYIAAARGRDLTLDEEEIAEARWVDRREVQHILETGGSEALQLPPRFTIARQLIEHWAREGF